MANPAGESNDGVLRLDFDRRLMLQFHGSVVTSDQIGERPGSYLVNVGLGWYSLIR
jgi:hypothetical protein